MALTIDKDRVERCARMYRTNDQMASAMGISGPSVARWCRKFGVESPAQRRKADPEGEREATPVYPEELGPKRRDAMSAGDLAERRARYRKEVENG